MFIYPSDCVITPSPLYLVYVHKTLKKRTREERRRNRCVSSLHFQFAISLYHVVIRIFNVWFL
jgi:hypothetical protein